MKAKHFWIGEVAIKFLGKIKGGIMKLEKKNFKDWGWTRTQNGPQHGPSTLMQKKYYYRNQKGI